MGLTKLRTGLRAATFALTGSLFAGAAFAQDTNVVGDLEIIGRPKPHGIGFQPPPNGGSAEGYETLLLLRILKVVRLLRLLRIARLYRYFTRWEEHFAFFNSNVLRLVKVFAIMAFFSHWSAQSLGPPTTAASLPRHRCCGLAAAAALLLR